MFFFFFLSVSSFFLSFSLSLCFVFVCVSFSTEYTLSVHLGHASASSSLALPYTESLSHPAPTAPSVTQVLDISELFDEQGNLFLDEYQLKLSQMWTAFQKKTQLPLNAVEDNDETTSITNQTGSKKRQ